MVSLALGLAAFGHACGSVIAGVLLSRLISWWDLVQRAAGLVEISVGRSYAGAVRAVMRQGVREMDATSCLRR